MRIIRVTYTVREEFVETNRRNIALVMKEVRELNKPGINYTSFIEPDGKTFMHFAMYPNNETVQIIENLPSFKSFRNALKESKPEVPPQAVDLSLVASSYDIF